ncbi:hypothetical protein AVEN_47213-1 [Araneus ventricosus]|uniref:Uncharacterized protein n=1 Tax=Araneus ventricosus TaxID=182803 RepID=A0A4Y2QB54_ARAVE|nr:hypothetical protein AVEN_47213-1 [Araneus ventricosus]
MGLSCKPVVKNKHPPADLFKQLGNPSSGDTKSFALKILQGLYPPSQSLVPPPNYLPLPTSNTSTSNTFHNECYQLHCFPEPLEKGIIALFEKDDKEADKIKSYRTVTMLLTIGKVQEQILLRDSTTRSKRNTYFITRFFGFRERLDPLTMPINWLKRYKIKQKKWLSTKLVEKIQDAKQKLTPATNWLKRYKMLKTRN